MPYSDLIEIKISRVIPTQMWKVIRLISRVEEFPQYMPNVKEVSVIQKTRHTIRTRWRVQVDMVPISWIEEDILALRDNAIYFKAVEGDIQEFRGRWSFREHPEGTEVTVDVFARVDIPGFNDFAVILRDC
ncbi:MAG: SRPBCC family protein [Candidatus Omnitrophica bacterium]|nr:SRPBCC family protein [Candidatus Omnitrophota bacterium]